MSRLYSHEYLIYNLAGSFSAFEREYIPQEAAYQLLKEVTGQDFGFDYVAWETWIKEQSESGSHVGVKCFSAWWHWKKENQAIIDAMRQQERDAWEKENQTKK